MSIYYVKKYVFSYANHSEHLFHIQCGKPTDHLPYHNLFVAHWKNARPTLDILELILYNISSYRGVAKFGIALGSGPRGLGFESRHSDQTVLYEHFGSPVVMIGEFFVFSKTL